MKTYTLKTQWGTTEKVTMTVSKYADRAKNLAIQLWCDDGPYATMTVNLGKKLAEDEGYVDTNNFPEAESFIKKYKLGKPTGGYGFSGFCAYPLYKFDLAKLGV